MIKKIELIGNNIDNICSTIKIYCEDVLVKLSAVGDCCSQSWFELYENKSFDECIGKTYIGCNDTGLTHDMEESEIQEHDINHIYELLFDDNTTFKFLLRNSSNGYYDGYILEDTSNANLYPIEGGKKSLIIIVGLPGSGKSTYAKMLKDTIKNSVLYDDVDVFLQSNIKKIRNDIENNKKVIIVHPNFCIYERYYDFINNIKLKNKSEAIITYCFSLDIEKSIKNIKTREVNETFINGYVTDIKRLSNYYVPNEEYINMKLLETY